MRVQAHKFLNFKMPKFLKGKTVEWEREDYGTDGFPCVSMEEYDLCWVDDFVQKIKPYVYVREVDRLLILIPNQVYRLNDSALRIMTYLLSGRGINELLHLLGADTARRRDIHYFFCDLRAIISGCLRENETRHAVDYYEFSGDVNKYPVLAEVAVTYRCNLNCEFCYVGESLDRELNTSDVKKILFKIHNQARIPSVSFTGGEPLLRDDIVELVSHAAEIGLWTNLITNGTLLDDACVKSLRKAGLSSVQVSIEGPNADIHDMITGQEGAFDAAIRGIDLLKDAGIAVHTNTTLSKHNIAYANGIVLLAKRLGLSQMSMNLLIPCGRALRRKNIWTSYSEVGDHIVDVKRFAAQQNMKFLWYSPVPLCKFNPIAHGLGNKACAAITGLLSVDPAGNVIPCSSWREPVGSLLERDFHDVWQSHALDFYKSADYAPSECRRCDNFAACKGACPLYWQACGKGEIDG
ncbi:MAG: radical SAM protein [candidate division WOR-3 bacterium]|nr:MAG: radical SAM protein [candidate division WOR-3 bacterium]